MLLGGVHPGVGSRLAVLLLSCHQGGRLMQRTCGHIGTCLAQRSGGTGLDAHVHVLGAGLEAPRPLEGFLPEAFLPLGPRNPS